MRVLTAMNDLDWLGAEGGRLSGAFAAGCIATFGFMSAIGAFLWRMIGNQRKDRITELEKDLAAEKAARTTAIEDERKHCAEQMTLMSTRIAQLEALFTMHTGIAVAVDQMLNRPAPALAAPIDGAPDSAE